MLRDEQDSPALLLSGKRCPECGGTVIQLGEEKPPPAIQIVTAIREADLTRDELSELVDVLRDAPNDASPRALAQRVPKASGILTAAGRAGADWRFLLTTILTVIALYFAYVAVQDADRAHIDAAQAHRDAVEAHEDAERAVQLATTGQLTEEQSLDILRQIDERLGEGR